jgi:aminoglycoside phosphotransferase (APT) family kinase protein
VTLHGDFHPNNIIFDSQDNPSLIDFEFSHVGYAANDLGYVILICKIEVKYKRLLL